MASSSPSRKLCFVTVGATAPFDLLIRASVTPCFLQYLASQNYTDLLIQHGKNGDKLLRDLLPQAMFDTSDPLVDPWAIIEGIKISRFDFRKEGLQREMLAARGGSLGYRSAGVVICHAGMLTPHSSSSPFPFDHLLLHSVVPITTSPFPGSILIPTRRRHNTRRSPPLRPPHRRAQPFPSRQPPRRACRRARPPGLRRTWQNRQSKRTRRSRGAVRGTKDDANSVAACE